MENISCWIHKGPVSSYICNSLRLCASPPPSVLFSLISCFKKIKNKLKCPCYRQALVLLQCHCKLSTQFSFKPKWHLTHPSNKSKQFKHRWDSGGFSWSWRWWWLGCRSLYSTPREITRSFKLLVL